MAGAWKDKNSIENLATAVFDNGRRGMPKPGCDCVQCFGYCAVDNDEAQRQQWSARPQAVVEGQALDFAE